MIELYKDLRVSLSSLMVELVSEIYICIDNFNIAKAAGSMPNKSS